MTKPVLAYVGHSYHRQTSSTVFLLDLLREHFQLEVVWDDSWQPGKPPLQALQVNASQPDLVLFFQTLPVASQLRKIQCPRLFFIPMHDNIVASSKRRWTELRGSGLRLINFCRDTHNYFGNLGYESLCVQYWPAPVARTPLSDSDTVRVFFWARHRQIGWPVLKALLGEHRPARIILRAAPDPGETPAMPSPKEIAEYRIELISGWLDKARYLELLNSCNVFVAPRLYEGIGQAFLEAMAAGMAVIAPDLPTITHARNGYLYSPATATQLDFSSLAGVRERALHDVAAGRTVWQAQERQILDFLHSDAHTTADLWWRLRQSFNL